MFKYVVLACILAVAAARPGFLHNHQPELRFVQHHQPELRSFHVHSEVPIVKTKLIHEPATIAVKEHTIERVGEHVETFPTAVSYQSQTIVHSNADKITPIVAPAIKTHYEPTVRTYEQKYVEKIPVVDTYVAPTVVKTVHEAPTHFVKSYEAPTVVKSFESHGIIENPHSHFITESVEAPAVFAGEERSDSVVIDAPTFPAHRFEGEIAAHGVHGAAPIFEHSFPAPIESQW